MGENQVCQGHKETVCSKSRNQRVTGNSPLLQPPYMV